MFKTNHLLYRSLKLIPAGETDQLVAEVLLEHVFQASSQTEVTLAVQVYCRLWRLKVCSTQ